MKYTDYKQVKELARSILKEDKQIITLVEELRTSLRTLKATFHDDGFDEVDRYAKSLLQRLSCAQESFLVVAKELLEYANLLESGKGSKSTTNERSFSSPNSTTSHVVSPSCPGISVLEPTRSVPRDLTSSNFGMVQDGEGNLVYNSPMETNQYLYKEQGSANPAYQGTCGLCSCANILRLAGVNATEGQMIAYASTTNDQNTLFQKLCATGYADPGMNGGTSPKSRQQILQNFGIDSGVFPLSREKDGSLSDSNLIAISNNVSAGRGVILSVHADILWYDAPVGVDDYHAVTVTSVKKDRSGNILGFYICDSANGGTAFHSAEKVKRALTGSPMNVTYTIIR